MILSKIKFSVFFLVAEPEWLSSNVILSLGFNLAKQMYNKVSKNYVTVSLTKEVMNVSRDYNFFLFLYLHRKTHPTRICSSPLRESFGYCKCCNKFKSYRREKFSITSNHSRWQQNTCPGNLASIPEQHDHQGVMNHCHRLCYKEVIFLEPKLQSGK